MRRPRGRKPEGHRLVLVGIFRVARDLPEAFRKRSSVQRRFRRRTLAVRKELILKALNDSDEQRQSRRNGLECARHRAAAEGRHGVEWPYECYPRASPRTNAGLQRRLAVHEYAHATLGHLGKRANPATLMTEVSTPAPAIPDTECHVECNVQHTGAV